MVPSDGWEVTKDGLVAHGWVDVSDSLGQRLYKMLKSNALTWSVGFRHPKKRTGPNGTRIIETISELIEISATPLAANPETRTLAAKSLRRRPPTVEELREQERRIVGDEPTTDHESIRVRVRDAMRAALSDDDPDDATPRTKTIRTRSTTHAPVRRTTPPPPAGPLRVARFDVA